MPSKLHRWGPLSSPSPASPGLERCSLKNESLKAFIFDKRNERYVFNIFLCFLPRFFFNFIIPFLFDFRFLVLISQWIWIFFFTSLLFTSSFFLLCFSLLLPCFFQGHHSESQQQMAAHFAVVPTWDWEKCTEKTSSSSFSNVSDVVSSKFQSRGHWQRWLRRHFPRLEGGTRVDLKRYRKSRDSPCRFDEKNRDSQLAQLAQA